MCLLPVLDIYILSIFSTFWHAVTLQFDPCPRKEIKVQSCLCTSGSHKGVEVYLRPFLTLALDAGVLYLAFAAYSVVATRYPLNRELAGPPTNPPPARLHVDISSNRIYVQVWTAAIICPVAQELLSRTCCLSHSPQPHTSQQLRHFLPSTTLLSFLEFPFS